MDKTTKEIMTAIITRNPNIYKSNMEVENISLILTVNDCYFTKKAYFTLLMMCIFFEISDYEENIDERPEKKREIK